MDGFFDLRRFVALLLRKIKWIVLVTAIVAIGWAAIRFVPQMLSYINYQEPQVTTAQEDGATTIQEIEDELPYRYKASQIIHIAARYETVGGNAVNRAAEFVDAYIACFDSEGIREQINSEFYERASAADSKDKQKMVDYNYRTKSVLNEVYSIEEFNKIVSCERVGDSFIRIYAQTADKQLSEDIVAKEVQLLRSQVTELMGSHETVVSKGATIPSLPAPQTGLTPKGMESGSSASALPAERPSLRHIAVQTVKGGVWGAMVGLALSIVLLLFFDVISVKLTTQNELEGYELPILSVGKKPGKKKRLFAFIDRWADKLEGNMEPCNQIQHACDIVKENILASAEEEISSLLVTGTAPEDGLQAVAEGLAKSFGDSCKVTASGCAVYHAQTIALARQAQGVVFVEEALRSNKLEIGRQIAQLRELPLRKFGFVLLK